jgi:hypothetical protein
MSKGLGRAGFKRQDVLDSPWGPTLVNMLESAFSAGIPIVLASGNFGGDANRKVIDTFPQVLENGDDFPLINVGATDIYGKHWSRSQGLGTSDGTQLTIYAPGDGISAHSHVDGPVSTGISGTSVSAPMVAGVIALHMVYQPWDRNLIGKDRVKAIRKFIRSPDSSWTRLAKEKQPDNLEVNMVSATLISLRLIVDSLVCYRSGMARMRRHTKALESKQLPSQLRSQRPSQRTLLLNPRAPAKLLPLD